jgi:sensor histidine kinase YesM
MYIAVMKEPANWNYKLKSLLIATGILLLFSIFYHFTLSYSITTNTIDYEEFFSFDAYNDNAGIQFIVMYVFILLTWLLIFVFMGALDIKIRLFTHLVTLPVVVIFSKGIFYWLSEELGYRHLEGGGEIWDIFIPAFFYLVVFTFLHGVEYYFKSQLRLKEKNKFATDSLRYELKAIKAQLNPHFLYNVFNTINANIPKENEVTREMIADLSDLLRYQLKASEVDKITLKDEIASIKTYLRLEKMRFKERLEIEYKIDYHLNNVIIPPMLIQPLIENAIKHGISKKKSGGKIELSIQKSNSKLQFIVKDTGEGIKNIDNALNKGFGLRHTKKRLEKFYNSQLHLEHNNPSGLIVKFEL